MALSSYYGPDSLTTETPQSGFQAEAGPSGPSLDFGAIANALERRRRANAFQSRAVMMPTPAPKVQPQGHGSGPGGERGARVDIRASRMQMAPPMKYVSHPGVAPYAVMDENAMGADTRRAFLPSSSTIVSAGGPSPAGLSSERPQMRPEPEEDTRADFFGTGTNRASDQRRTMMMRALMGR